MVWNKEGAVFNNLRELAQRLDFRLGVEKRKLILAGNEKLTFATDAKGWTTWTAAVETRLKSVVGTEAAREMLLKTGMIPTPFKPLPTDEI